MTHRDDSPAASRLIPATGTVDVAVLGPLEIRVDGHAIEVSAGRLRALVAVLAMSAGRPVSADTLVAAVWGEQMPLDARRSVRTYMTRLRRLLGPAAIRSLPQGYLLFCRDVDALRFQELLDAAAAAADRSAERTLLAQALALWRGSPFDGVRAVQLEQVEAARLTELYLSAVERHIDLDLAAGRDRDLVGRLRELTARHPLRERFWAQLMTALFHSGRQADALQAYQSLHRMLDDELGVAPGSAVRELHRRILLGDATPGPPTAVTGPSAAVPRQLPAAVAHLAGRAAELALLDDVVQEADERPAVVMITGGAGVGKTTLAIDWARRAAASYPDGQLYLDLRGFGPPELTVGPGEALRAALEALGVPPAHVPTSLDAQSGLYRSLLAGKRVLVLLDNAADAAQVLPVLPATAGCLTVVTGRRLLPGLVTRGAHPLVLDVLARDGARDLLAARLGADRVSAEPAAADRIIEACAGLPLALAIASARAATSPRFSLTALAADIDAFPSSLDALASADADTDIRSVFRWSYAALSPAAQRLFRLLSLDCGAVTRLPAAASLAGVAAAAVRPLLDQLCQAHLLTEHAPRRYGYHDLLRVYAAELLEHTDGDPGRDAALHRLLDHYVTTACQAAQLIEPLRDPIKVVRPRTDTTGEPFADREQALAWFHEHLPTLLAAVNRAADTGLDAHTWQLTWALADFLQWQGRWNERLTTLTTALAATRRLGDRDEQARAHRGLGVALTKLGRHEQAAEHLRQALELYQELGNTVGQVRTHQGLSHVSERLADHRGALRHVEHALNLSGPAGSTAGLGRLLNSAGWCHAQLGELTQARRQCEQALTLLRDAGDRVAEAATWDSLGYISYRQGDTEQALRLYATALELRKAIGHRYGEAITLDRVGDTHEARGDLDAARERWQEALLILEEMGEPGADAVRAKVEPR
ncbi:MAG: tetratricopeptide repeat protein [Hamadaea sp.]|nr:tetratricopeptide repeat protein [Hamadaea sp.]